MFWAAPTSRLFAFICPAWTRPGMISGDAHLVRHDALELRLDAAIARDQFADVAIDERYFQIA